MDIASTGGPGSLSTLLAPLCARALGARVSKIAVPGRPAGGLDSLGTLGGYRTDVDERAATDVLNRAGYLHVAAGSTFCPLDASFFWWRQANDAQAIPNLAIVSLLAKKIAAGAATVVLDVRVGPHGNFGDSIETARSNAQRFVQVAQELGIRAICALSNANPPVQPWVGRGEALVAVGDALSDKAVGRLREHADECMMMASLAVGSEDSPDVPRAWGLASDAHETMLTAHGADPDAFWRRVTDVRTSARVEHRARVAGAVDIDIDGIRRSLVARQNMSAPVAGAAFPDPCGLRFAVEPGAHVEAGDLLVEIRDDGDAAELLAAIEASVTIDCSEHAERPRYEPPEIVRG